MDLHSKTARQLALAVAALMFLFGVHAGHTALTSVPGFFARQHDAATMGDGFTNFTGLINRVIEPIARMAIYLMIGSLLVKTVASWTEGESTTYPLLTAPFLRLVGWAIVVSNLPDVLYDVWGARYSSVAYRSPVVGITLFAPSVVTPAVAIIVGILLIRQASLKPAPPDPSTAAPATS